MMPQQTRWKLRQKRVWKRPYNANKSKIDTINHWERIENRIDLNHLFEPKATRVAPDELFDVIVIGGGVVGTGIFRRFALGGAKTLLVERANDILEGASKGNSAILHTGFDAPPESLELQCVKDGYAEYMKIKDALDLSFRNTQAVVVAWTDEQLEKLGAIQAKGFGNGIQDLDLLNAAQLHAHVPNLSDNAQGAILVHGESIVDPWRAPLAYLKQGIAAGGKTAFGHEVTGGHRTGEYWELETSRGTLRAKTIINAAGLYGDVVDRIKGAEDFKIIPRKGQFILFDKTAFDLVGTIILPVPTKITKGVVVTPTAFGNILVGPTAEDQESRTDSRTVEKTLHDLQEKAFQIIPKLREHKIVATFAGLRPASDEPQYRVMVNDTADWITVGGIRSTGLTASLGLAQHIWRLHDTAYADALPDAPIVTTPNISVFGQRDYERPGYDRIVCHCEHVTEREIRDALRGESGAGTWGGLKRRTRAGMGRCQGFNCAADVARIIEEEQGARHD
jgi:glycerol-3-phosphate dehydrogenase